ncbi:MAG: excinuclease ABC subunit UvrA [Rikenellaceae bacterium]
MAANKEIIIEGARVHNLKNISLKIKHGEFTVITGLSGSGKSSLAFDTLFAEGQRRYVESLSSYARQFLGRMSKPEVDKISGLAPSIAIEQKVTARSPRSTVGTSTEIYDYLKLFFARAGKVYSPISGEEVKSYDAAAVASFIIESLANKRIVICGKVDFDSESNLIEKLVWLGSDGHTRFFCGNNYVDIKDLMGSITKYINNDIYVVIDRIVARNDDDTFSRLSDSTENCYQNFDNRVTIISEPQTPNQKIHNLSNYFEIDGISFETPTEHLFSFNSPIGACPVCNGYGKITGIDENLVVPDKNKTLYEDAIMPWRGETMRKWKEAVINSCEESGFPIHKPYKELSAKHREWLWKGCNFFHGIDDFFAMLEREKYKIQYRVIISRYTGKRICPECNGARVRKEALYVKIGGYDIAQLTTMPANKLLNTLNNLTLDEYQKELSQRILKEITSRVETLCNVGLEYLNLDRLSNTLSGGESQRINLATSIGSPLVGSMYILDEPSIGLHPRDTARLIGVLKSLRDLGNSVIVVEHDEEIIASADHIIDIGPLAGEQGGEVVFEGSLKKLLKSGKSLTAAYMQGKESIKREAQVRKLSKFIKIVEAFENNLKNITVSIPLNAMSVVTGVSGSGKSSLVKGILFPALNRHFNGTGHVTNKFKEVCGDLKLLKGVEMIDQNPIGRSSRSNPVTYIKAYDEIRKLYSSQHAAKIGGFSPSYFSFNIAGGRCDACEGEGVIRVDMQFMADIEMVCEECGGRRFKDEILQIKYRNKSIDEVLNMSVNEAIEFFGQDDNNTARKIVEKLTTLQNVGLGYVKLGQSSSTLSGGESQRVKLAYFLLKEGNEPLIFIFDEPTTGLHFHDIKKLLSCFDALINKGHTIVVVEHNMEVVKCADYIIDLGKEGGDNGGELIFEGTLEDFKQSQNGYTVKYL